MNTGLNFQTVNFLLFEYGITSVPEHLAMKVCKWVGDICISVQLHVSEVGRFTCIDNILETRWVKDWVILRAHSSRGLHKKN